MKTAIRRSLAGVLLVGCACSSSWGAIRTWDGGGGDNQWGNADNWSENTMPVAADMARVTPVATPIQLGDDRTVNDVQFSGTPNPTVIEGAGKTLTLASGKVSGNGNGTQTGGLACDVVVGASNTWGPLTTWGSRLNVYGNVTDQGNGYDVTFIGDSNGGTRIGGTWNLAGRMILQCYTLVVGATYTNSLGVASFGGRVQGAASIDLDCRMAFSDNHDSYFVLENALQADNDRIASGIPVRTVRNGGSFEVKGNASTPVAESISLLDLQSGQLKTLRANGATASVATDLTIAAIQRASGTSAMIGNANGGRVFVPGAANVNGIWHPWFFAGAHYTKVAEDASILSCATGDYLTLASSGNDPTKIYKTSTNVALTDSTEVWGLRLEAGTAQTLDLGAHSLTIGSGALIATGNNNKLVTATTGRLVFAGDDIILNTDGTGTFTNSATMAWAKPAGSAQTYPSLVVARGYREVVALDGVDEIGTYSNLFASVYRDTSRKTLVLGGPSDRTFNGTVTGIFNLEKRGAGTLTFNGEDQRRSGNATVYDGRLVGGANAAPVPTGGVKAGARYDIAAGVDIRNYPKIETGGTIGGLGRDLYPLRAQDFQAGAILSPGMLDEVGLLTITSSFTPAGSYVYELDVDAAANDRLHVVGTHTFPPSGSTVTFRIKDRSNRTADMRDRVLDVLTSQTAFAGTTNVVNYTIENLSPLAFDTSAAAVTVDTAAWKISISGIRNVPQGSVVFVR